ncbi:M61 family metallopeptidase [Lunatimonas salinarum]|uniref:M61 family metallopeptidase n=1 Tax=Lunatimonas salinarum TaxID=1774590 RepID=UPI001ADFB115|nr:M61 family metallopeptidase [Lunatimonas salinarum]
MHYKISQNIPTSQYIQVELKLDCQAGEVVSLQLPAWRPGRYELANYAQNIRKITIFSQDRLVPMQKLSKDLWVFRAEQPGEYMVEYEYYAAQMDAGGCWADTEQVYVNFSNIAFAIEGRSHEEITVAIEVPENYQVATSLVQLTHLKFWAFDYQQLIDSPFIASASLQHESYQVENSTFHLWFMGDIYFDMASLIEVFRTLTNRQIAAFGEFPAENYHFIFQLLPYTHYHGVEHKFSTVITYGPAASLTDPNELSELIGVSSHELYHFWNVCRIRPAVILPYDLSKEAYLQEGVVAEGVTTYFGDMYLLRSGFFSLSQYLAEIAKRLNREGLSQGWKHQSIAESSFDLWLDGYKPGIPDKKVSIYNRGALISLCLDVYLMQRHSSLEDVMKYMWREYGRQEKGYSLVTFQSLVAQCAGDISFVSTFFQKFIFGTEDLLPTLRKFLRDLDIVIRTENIPNSLGTPFGILADDSGKITQLHPDAPAYLHLMRGDQINKKDFTAQLLELHITRNGKPLSIKLPKTDRPYFENYVLIGEASNNPLRNQWMR